MNRLCNRGACLLLLLTCFCCAASQLRPLSTQISAAPLRPADESTRAQVHQAYGQLPLSFEVNQGQADAAVAFLARGHNYSFQLTRHDLTIWLGEPAPSPITVRMELADANPAPRLKGTDELSSKSHYLTGNDPAKWRRNVPHYARVHYEAIYPGVDLVYYGNGRQLEYDFIVAPGADPGRIKLRFDGVRNLALDDDGDLLLQTAAGELRQHKPFVYQETSGVRREVAGHYVIAGEREVSFALGDYDASQSLVIDPVLVYATRNFAASEIAVDDAGHVYLLATNYTSQLPTSPGALQTRGGSADLYVAKLNATGTALVFATYLGGNDTDLGTGIAADAAGNLYITGTTRSFDFPLVNPLQSFIAGAPFLRSSDTGRNWSESAARLPAAFNDLALHPANPATLYAGSRNGFYRGDDSGNDWQQLSRLPVLGLALDHTNPAIIYAANDDGVFKSFDGGRNWNVSLATRELPGRLVRTLVIDPSHAQVVYAVAFGEFAIYKSVDGGRNWRRIGMNLPTIVTNAESAYSDSVASAALAIDSSNPATLYLGVNHHQLTQLGGGVFKSTDGGESWTNVTSNVYSGLVPAIVIDPRHTQTIYAAYYSGVLKSTDGGRSWIRHTGQGDFYDVLTLALDPADSTTLYAGTRAGVYQSRDGGVTWSKLYAGQSHGFQELLINPAQPATFYAVRTVLYADELFIAKLDPSGAALRYSTYLGGRSAEGVARVVADAAGNAYVTGATSSTDFPTTPGALRLATDRDNIFVAKLNATGTTLAYAALFGGSKNEFPHDLALDAEGNAYIVGLTASTDFPVTPGAYRTTPDGIFVTKLNTIGTSLSYATFLDSGLSFDVAAAYVLPFQIGVDAAAQAYIAGFKLGSPNSPNLIWKLDQAGATTIYTRSFGSDRIRGFAVDADGNAYLTGTTARTILPVTADAFQPQATGGICGYYTPPPICNKPPPWCPPTPPPTPVPIACTEAFIVKLTPAGATAFASFLGGSSLDYADGLALDAARNVYIFGRTSSRNFPLTAGALSAPGAESGGYLVKLNLDDRRAPASSVSAASYLAGALAPEAIIAAFGDNLATAARAATSTPLPTELAGTTVTVKDGGGVERLAPLFFVAPTQINYQLPAGTAHGLATITIANANGQASFNAVLIAPVQPGLFTVSATGGGLVAGVVQRVKPDGTQTYEPLGRFDPAQNRVVAVPIDLGAETDEIYLSLFGTGWRGRSAETAVGVMIGGQVAPVTYAGLQPTLIGVDQINVRLPRSLAGRGEVDVVVVVDGKTANTVKVSVR